ncbi:hypothetical protein HBI69_058990 [Parastagonospora nodorum]|nr:hypothetical protein HBI69_058990 [Parastagonospora nodorum]
MCFIGVSDYQTRCKHAATRYRRDSDPTCARIRLCARIFCQTTRAFRPYGEVLSIINMQNYFILLVGMFRPSDYELDSWNFRCARARHIYRCGERLQRINELSHVSLREISKDV